VKIGLIGNMNNNNFAFLRYLINLGYDANLIIFKNEISGNNKHFSPEADTWNIGKWKKYIIQSNLSEDPVSVFNFPISYLFSLKSIFEALLNKRNIFKKPVKKKEIFKLFSQYDFLIGSGITPAMLNRVDIKLDIFYPYSFGIEWLGSPTFIKKLYNKNFIIRFFAKKILIRQLKGIKSANKIITVLDSVTKDVLRKYNLKSESSFIPMLYNLEKLPNKIKTDNKKRIENITNEILKSDFSIFCHSRHIWFNDENLNKEDWKKINKNSDWLIRGFSNFLKKTTKKNPILIMLEYGKDYNKTKNLCRDLKIEKNIFWLPKLERKNIMWFLSKIDVGIGEFYEIDNMLFGGTGYEVLSSGKPFIQSFNFNKESFKKQYSSPLPPVLAASNIIEIENHLMKLSFDENYYKKISKSSKAWFNKYCGIGLAKTIIESSLQK
tara:strand:+ start:1193 stop:2500 length:1308 start_codon:yes stop_codon:yes gene_type:complete